MSETAYRGLSLTRKQLIVLLAFYCVVILGSLISAVMLLRQFVDTAEATVAPLWVCVVGSFLSAALGSSVFYMRKLYKLCISDELSIPQCAGTREWGTMLYFVTRPLFACAFAFLLVISLKAENHFVSPSGSIESTNFIYISMFVSFLAGFSAGKMITFLERKGVPIDEG